MDKKVIWLLLGASCVASHAHAAGFYLKEQSIVSQGQAFAGVAAQSGMASATYFNPAGLVGIEQSVVEGGVHLIFPDQKVKDNSTGSVLHGGNGNTTDQTPLADVIAVPNLYWATPLSNKTVLGLGVNAPFGSENEYQTNYFGRYNHIKASLKTVDYTAAVGHQVNESLNIGVSIYYQTLDVEQIKAAPNTGGLTTLKGDGTEIGYSVGAQYQAGLTTMGFSYRSGTNQDISGTNVLAGVGNYSATSMMKLPSITSVGIEHEMSDLSNLYFGMTHYQWSVYDSGVVYLNGVATPATVHNYSDTISYSVGADYQYSTDLVLRGGYHFDPTPTDDQFRSLSTPDGDRQWLSFGLSKKLDRSLDLDLALTHIQVDDTSVNLATAKANIETTHNIISIGLRKTF